MTHTQELRHFIGGKRIAGGGEALSLNPSNTNDVVARASEGSALPVRSVREVWDRLHLLAKCAAAHARAEAAGPPLDNHPAAQEAGLQARGPSDVF